MYLLLRGNFDLADRNADGTPAALRDMGETPDFEIMINEERAENMATGGRFNVKDLSKTIMLDVTGSLKVKEAAKANLELAVFGTATEEAGGVRANVAFPGGIAAGEKHFLPGHPLNVSNLVIKDNSDPAETLDEGTDYEADLKFGTVVFKTVAGFTPPFKASFTEGASVGVSIGSAVPGEKFLYFRGINIAEDEKPCVAEFYRVKFSPAEKIALKTEEGKQVTGFDFKLEFLADQTKDADPVFGQYGRLRYV